FEMGWGTIRSLHLDGAGSQVEASSSPLQRSPPPPPLEAGLEPEPAERFQDALDRDTLTPNNDVDDVAPSALSRHKPG
ncbi:MAG: hypothetical protein L7S64_01150, partial [Longimicrobiales bacterium]|nr:hypothetical protein [Longimicrobiales bacterium]